MSALTKEDMARQRARNEEVARAGERWLSEKAVEIDGLATGTVVIFEIETGEYVTAATRLEAMKEFDRIFGEGRPGFIHEVRRRVFLGGGLLG